MTPIERQVLDLEKKYWKALKDGDVDTAASLTDEPCFITGANGIGSVDHRSFKNMMRNAEYQLNAVRVGDDAQVRLLSDDVAIVAYRVTEDITVGGQPITVEAADSSTWVRRDGRWLCALHSEALRGDPYGRDRSHGSTPPATRFQG
jgi:uncharacterized protein (TIGR02246 family)